MANEALGYSPAEASPAAAIGDTFMTWSVRRLRSGGPLWLPR